MLKNKIKLNKQSEIDYYFLKVFILSYTKINIKYYETYKN